MDRASPWLQVTSVVEPREDAVVCYMVKCTDGFRRSVTHKQLCTAAPRLLLDFFQRTDAGDLTKRVYDDLMSDALAWF